MKRVLFQTQSKEVFEAYYQDAVDSLGLGGRLYNAQIGLALRNLYSFDFDRTTVREGVLPIYLLRFLSAGERADFIIQDPFITALGKRNRAGKVICMVHHIDYTLKEKSLKWKWFLNRLERRLPGLDAVVTVSHFWRQYLENLGCRNVHVIYNSFPVEKFTVDRLALEEFKKRYEIPREKPLVYIGNARAQKGINDVYHALKDEGYTLVTTGPRASEIDLPILRLSLPYADYIKLLHACDLVLTMSTMLEGWNRTAHEAMLCHTPVVGSGSGGMRELLEGGGQLICLDFMRLPELCRRALAEKKAYAQKGYAFATHFDMKYFRESWKDLLQNMD